MWRKQEVWKQEVKWRLRRVWRQEWRRKRVEGRKREKWRQGADALLGEYGAVARQGARSAARWAPGP